MARDFATKVGGGGSLLDMQRRVDDATARMGERIDAASSYTPADPSAWSGSPPSTLAEALDRIAAALGPIA